MGSTNQSFFHDVTYTPPDAIFELTKAFNADPSESKVNLGQGTYKDENGDPWILPAVQAAKRRVEGTNHEYLPILGLPAFRNLATELLFGQNSTLITEKRVASCQALSGTGALHLAGKMLFRASKTGTIVYITDPSWSNHRQVFESIGFTVRTIEYVTSDGELNIESLIRTLRAAPRRSIFVLHASAHNPSGWDPTPAQWRDIGAIFQERELYPLFDAAYLGLTSGDFDQDSFVIRYFAESLGLETSVCLSFAKSMGLYAERIGLCCFVGHTSTVSAAVESNLAQIVRVEVSNPPAYGARIVASVLEEKNIRAEWERNLVTMSTRILDMRTKLSETLTQLETPGKWQRIKEQKGMFSILGLSLTQVEALQEKYHIYMAASSRISIAGLNDGNVHYVATCIDRIVRE